MEAEAAGAKPDLDAGSKPDPGEGADHHLAATPIQTHKHANTQTYTNTHTTQKHAHARAGESIDSKDVDDMILAADLVCFNIHHTYRHGFLILVFFFSIFSEREEENILLYARE